MAYSFDDAEYAGHLPLSYLLGKSHQPNPDIVAVLRDPVDRFVSAVNYRNRGGRKWSLDEAMEMARDRAETDSVFMPQSHFLDRPANRVFPFERLHDVFAYLGIPRKWVNAHPKKWTAEEITNHPLFAECMKAYGADYELRAKL